ncbi:hypothetical protein GCM10025858_15530 [Alicyclobacillus sacchari]|nr:hypothetical protein GCM10025858_15530 [Alicyclobacillus sacchari]
MLLESMEFPEPVISVSIEPKTKADQDKMGIALSKLAEEDPTFKTYTDPETGQTIIQGMGELHLEVIVDRMQREFKVECNVGMPQVAYRETITKRVDQEGKFVRQSGGRGQYGHVKVIFEPLERGQGFVFENKIVGGVIPKEYIPAVEEGIHEAMRNGVLAGYPLVDVKATLYDGSYHDVDSSEMAFKIAGSMALKAGAEKAARFCWSLSCASRLPSLRSIWVTSWVTSTRAVVVSKVWIRAITQASYADLFRCQRCLVIRPRFAHVHKAAVPTRWNSLPTKKCRRVLLRASLRRAKANKE